MSLDGRYERLFDLLDDVTRGTVEVKGSTLTYNTVGEGDLTFLMVHGNPSSSYSFRYLMVELSGDARCISLDLPGFGASDKPEDPGFYTLDNMIDIYKGFVLKLDLHDIVLVVHEIGGLIATGGAIDDPSRYRGIVLINTITRPTEKLPLKVRRKYISPPDFDYNRARGYQELIFTKGYQTVDAESVEYHLGVNNDDKTTVGILSLLNAIPRSKSHPNYSRVFTILSKLESWDIPTLLIFGEKSYLFDSKRGEELSRKMARPRFHSVDGGSFFLHEERWQEVMFLIDEWRSIL